LFGQQLIIQEMKYLDDRNIKVALPILNV
jgi:hypothetical protein